jgi:hypothetical protein
MAVAGAARSSGGVAIDRHCCYKEVSGEVPCSGEVSIEISGEVWYYEWWATELQRKAYAVVNSQRRCCKLPVLVLQKVSDIAANGHRQCYRRCCKKEVTVLNVDGGAPARSSSRSYNCIFCVLQMLGGSATLE